ncbi:MAG: hypothetical protein O7J95_09870 [Planctomycetota bacterium]|nr:hypothetical protein [Planctomycetota bacterium]
MSPPGERNCTLRKGWFDGQGTVYRQVRLRPARAIDEIRALEDFRVYLRPERFPHVLLARVITQLGPLTRVDPGLLERLDPHDMRLLEATYRQMNGYVLDARRPSGDGRRRERGRG